MVDALPRPEGLIQRDRGCVAGVGLNEYDPGLARTGDRPEFFYQPDLVDTAKTAEQVLAVASLFLTGLIIGLLFFVLVRGARRT